MICVIKECTANAVKTGLCSSHYKRRAIGDYSIHKIKQVRGSFANKLIKYTKRLESGCLEWIGPKNPSNQYGRITYKGKRTQAHRAAYDFTIGIRNKKNHIHHKCGNKLCVEVTHLEELSHFFHLKEHKRDKLGRLLPHSNS